MSILQMNIRGGAMLALALLVLPPALAQDASKADAPLSGAATGCAAFKWLLENERRAFEDAALEQIASGTARGAWKEQSFALALQPDTEVPYTLPPTRRKEADGKRFGGMIAFAAPAKAGVYQVTISGEGWIDLVQQGKSLKSAAHSSVKDCPGLRKSVRFAIANSPLVLQISGAADQSIKIAIAAVE